MRLLLTLASLLTGLSARADDVAPSKVLFDFDDGGFERNWNVAGELEATAAEPPEAATEAAAAPAGLAAKIETPARGRWIAAAKQVPADWLKYDELWLWVYRGAAEAERGGPLTFEVVIAEQGQAAHFWRRVDVEGGGWQKVALPLKWFRQGPGRVARWDKIDRLEFRFRGAGRLWIDSITLREGKSHRAAELSEDDLRTLAFPSLKPDQVRAFRSDNALILTDEPELDLDMLGAHLNKVVGAVLADMPFLEKPPAPATLLVFSSREDFAAFTPALAKKLNSQAEAPSSGGFTVQGVATSFWDPRQGALRPVYTHEFVHSLLERTARLGNQGEWFQEGLASRYQLKFHPQENFGEIVRLGVTDPMQHLPLERLLSGRAIPTNRYWQAATVAEMLLTDPDHRKRVPSLVEAFQDAGSTALEPQLKTVLETDWQGFERSWRQHCAEKYPP